MNKVCRFFKSSSKDYYQILGISKNASLVEIKKAFRKLTKMYHPDVYKEDDKKFEEILEAFSVLRQPKQRREYDGQYKEEEVKQEEKTDNEFFKQSSTFDQQKMDKELNELRMKKMDTQFDNMRIYENQLHRQFSDYEKKRDEFVENFEEDFINKQKYRKTVKKDFDFKKTQEEILREFNSGKKNFDKIYDTLNSSDRTITSQRSYRFILSLLIMCGFLSMYVFISNKEEDKRRKIFEKNLLAQKNYIDSVSRFINQIYNLKCRLQENLLDCFLISKDQFTKTDYKIRLHNSTSNELNFPSRQELVLIVRHSFYKEECAALNKHIYKKLQEDKKKWRKIIKTLNLINVVIELGSKKAVQNLNQQIFLIKQLVNFSYVEGSMDRGIQSKLKSKIIGQRHCVEIRKY